MLSDRPCGRARRPTRVRPSCARPNGSQALTTTARRVLDAGSMKSDFLYAPLWVVGPLVLGFAPAALTFALDPAAQERLGLGVVAIPVWMFVGVWAIAFDAIEK